jgi:catechol 2,3-dioxygenase-like lactoylglutathione lyase family enzyme
VTRRIRFTHHSQIAALLLLGGVLTGFSLRPAAPLQPRFNHVMLYVSDLDASSAFYTRAFDLTVTQRIDTLRVTPPDGAETTRAVRMALLKFPGQDFVYELAERQVQNDGPSPFFQHVGVDVTDIQAAAARVQAAGGRDFSGLSTVRTSGGTVAKNGFFKGPDGEMVELMQVLQGEF